VIIFKSVNIWQSYKQERGCPMHFARLANTLLKDLIFVVLAVLQGPKDVTAVPVTPRTPWTSGPQSASRYVIYRARTDRTHSKLTK